MVGEENLQMEVNDRDTLVQELFQEIESYKEILKKAQYMQQET